MPVCVLVEVQPNSIPLDGKLTAGQEFFGDCTELALWRTWIASFAVTYLRWPRHRRARSLVISPPPPHGFLWLGDPNTQENEIARLSKLVEQLTMLTGKVGLLSRSEMVYIWRSLFALPHLLPRHTSL